MHLDLTLEEAVAHLTGDYQADVAAYDRVHEHILRMADILAGGIISQFPDQFTLSTSEAEMSLSVGMRKLWEDHITWTRLFIVSAAANLPDLDATTQRLLQNQTDIGNAMKVYYGDAAGNELTALLRDHILTAAELVTAAKAGDNAAVESASAKWYANADQIAAFLNGANQDAWPLDAVQMQMKMHLDLTLEEAVAQLQGDYPASIADYDQVHEHILALADILSSGIVSQFPEMFGGTTIGMPRTGHPQDDMPYLWLTLAVVAGLAVGGGLLLKSRVPHAQ
jgi:hypothetical protein